MTTAYYFNPAQHPKNTAHGYITDETGQWIEYDYGEETFLPHAPMVASMLQLVTLPVGKKHCEKV